MPAWKKMVLHGSSGSLAHLKLENLTSQSVLGTDSLGNVVAGSVSGYSLPTATSSVLGGIKIGGTLAISSGILNARTYIGASEAAFGEGEGGGAAGVAGYVPTASAAQYLSFLRGDGTWQTPTNTVTRLRQSAGTLAAGDFTFAGSGATTVSFAAGIFTISSTDTNTTYSVGDGGLSEKNFTATLKTKLDGIATSADNYSSWTISDSVRSEAIRSGDTLTIRGSGATSVTYDIATNVMVVSSTDSDTNTTYSAGTGLTLTGTTFSVTTNTYADAAHSHAIRDITDLQTALDSKQVAGSYAASSHTHDDRYLKLTETSSFFDRIIDSAPGTLDTLNELAAAIGDDANFSASIAGVLARKSDSTHTHAISAVTGLQTALDGKQASLGFTPYNATNPSGYITSYVDTVTSVGISGDLSTGNVEFRGSGATTISKSGGTITISSTDTDTNTTYSAGTGLTLTGTTFSVTSGTYAAASHTHTIGNVTGLQTALDGKQASGDYSVSGHTHAIRDITDLQTSLDGKQASLGFTPYNATNPSGYITGYTETNTFLSGGGNADTHPGTSRLIFTGQVSSGASVLGMPASDNSNAFLNINRHPGEYNSQLGFSSNGSMYYRSFSANAINSTQAWRQVWDSGNLTNLNQLTNGPGYITSYVNTVTSVGISGDLSTGNVEFRGSGATTISKSGGTITISSTDTDTNTTYSAGTGLTLTGTTFSVASGTYAASSHTHGIDSVTDAARWWNNFGDGHGTRTSFDVSAPSYGFGWRYVQGSTNGPGTGGSQFYSLYVGLGNDYPSTGAGSYGMYLAIDRNQTNPYLSVRFNENNGLSSWRRINAGYADSAGAVAWDNVSSKPSTFSPSSHTHTIGNVTGLQTALDGKQASGDYSVSGHTHAIRDITDLQTTLDGKQASGNYAASSHTHTIGNVTGLQTALDGKLGTSGKAADSETIDGIDSSRIVYGDGVRKSTSLSTMNSATGNVSGFFFYDSPTGNPFGDWTHWISSIGNSWDNNYGFQIAHAFHSDGFAVRRVTNGSFGSWRTIIDSGNIGSQSVNYASSAGAVAWDNVSSKPTTFTPSSHTHTISNVTGLQTALDGKQASGDYSVSGHTHAIRDVTDLQTTLDGKQASLGFTPYNATNPSGFITGYTETDTLATVTNRGNSTSQNIVFSNGRKGLVGVYDAAQTQAIFAMGAAYVLTDGGGSGTIGDFYGLGWSYNPGYGGAGNNPQSKAGLNHQLLLMQAGVTTAALGSGIWTSGNIAANNFSGTSSGTNTGDQTNISGNAATATNVAYSGLTGTVPTWNQDTTGNASKLNPLSGDGNYKLAYTADGARNNAGEWGRAVMFYVPNSQTYGIRVDRADLADTATNSNYINSTRDTPSNALQYWQAPGLGLDEAPSGDWHNTIRMGHGSPLSYYSNTLAIRMTGTGVGDIYTQTIMNGTRQGWKKHWNDSNLTNLNQLTNGPGYITSYVDTVTSVGISGDLSTGNVEFRGSGATTISKSGGTITISSTDTDTNTTYTAGTGLTLSGTTFSVTSGTYAAASHTHSIGNVTGLQTALDSKQASGDYSVSGHTHAIRDITDLQTTLDGKQASGNYAASSHTHDDRYYTESESDDRFLRIAVNSSSPTNATFAIGTASDRNFIQSHSGRPLDINPLGNTVTIGGNTAIHTGNYSSYALPLSGGTVTGIAYFQTNNGAKSGATDSAKLQAYSTGNNAAFMSFHKSGNYAVNFGLDDDNVMRLGGWSAAANRMQLDMSGNVTFAGNVTGYSDARIKTDVKTIDNALEKVKSLRGVSFTRTDSDDRSTNIGVIAQEVLDILPEVVSQDASGMYNVAYGNMAGLFIEAIKQQQTLIEQQQKQIDQLKALVDDLTK